MPGVRLLDLTLPSAAENLALDEALLAEAEASPEPLETLRLWEPAQAVVVVGRGSRAHDEVQLDECQARSIPVLRRTSGGLTIVSGPGCLMYSLVLSLELRPSLRAVDEAHRFILGTACEGIGPLAPGLARQGTSDLTIGPRKVSGNSLQLKRHSLLYHGTLLYDFPLNLVGELLAMPHRAPDYRQGRAHDEFVANLPASARQLRAALTEVWGAKVIRTDWPRDLVRQLIAEKYSQDEWNLRR